jgi:hypothetical protein
MYEQRTMTEQDIKLLVKRASNRVLKDSTEESSLGNQNRISKVK